MWLSALAIAIAFQEPARALVISEIYYNPPSNDEGLAFVEITNDYQSPEDISGWSFSEGIRFTFPPGTILRGGERLAVCANANLVAERYGIENAIGDFEGRLDSAGERVTLVNHAGIVIQSVRFDDRAPWPVAADGTGQTLTLKSVHTDTSLPENWTFSEEFGGSPGAANTARERNEFEDTVWIDLDVPWRFRRGTAAFSTPSDAWYQPGFDDSSWESGLPGFGFGDDDDRTILDDMENTYTSLATRLRFTISEGDLDEYTKLVFSINFDDGFCAFLNGEILARNNCPELLLFDSVSTGSREARENNVMLFEIRPDLVQLGENVLAIAGFNRSLRNNDFSLIPRLLLRRFPNVPRPTDADIVLNELFRAPSSGGWVELFSNDDAPIDLSGWTLTDDPERAEPYVFPVGTAMMPGEFLVVDEAASGLSFSPPEVRLLLRDTEGFVIAATVFSRAAPDTLGDAPFAEGRFPDGEREAWITPTATPGAPNNVPLVTDIVINEIFYHPPEDRDGEFIELYNRGSQPVDLSGFRFDEGISFAFPAGLQLGPGEYLVLAENPTQMIEIYDPPLVLGPFDGGLANTNELVRLVDALGNPVDEVRYYDGGQWSHWADGRGSSLELIDARQPNNFGPAWAESDESSKSSWEEHTFVVPKFVAVQQSELRLFLVERGACLVDDVTITSPVLKSDVLIDAGEEWRYAKGTEAFSSPADAWTQPDFDDSNWLVGPSGFGFADDDDATILEDMAGLYTTVAIRKRFDLTAEQAAGELSLGVDFDDGFCAYLNGQLVASQNCVEPVLWNSNATRPREAGEEVNYPIAREAFQAGTNVLAIVGVNSSRAVDFSLIPRVLIPTGVEESDNLIANGDFESTLEPWRVSGTHGLTDRTEVDAFSGTGSLHLIASSKGDGQCNSVDIDTKTRLPAAASYTISFATRWLRGASTLLWSGGFGQGPWGGGRDFNLSGNPMGDRVRMAVPFDLGTPGRENSVTEARRALRGTENTGPVLSGATHTPAVPDPADPVTFRVRALDADGVKSVRVFLRTTSQPTVDDIRVDLSRVGDDVYEGQLPQLPRNERRFFYYEAEDETGEVSTFPTTAPDVTLVFVVGENRNERLHINVANTPLNPGNLLSNQLVSGTVIHDGEVFYDVGMRYRGSPWGRPSRQSLRLRFPKDHLFKGMRRDINVSNRDRESDGPAHFIIGRNGTPEHPAPASDYKYITARLGNASWGTPGLFEPFDRDFIAKWFGDAAADDGILLKSNGRLSFDNRCGQWRWDEAALRYRDERRENYRYYFHHSINQSRDNWDPFIELNALVDASVTDDATLDSTFDTVVDIESLVRTLGPRIMVGDGDALFVGNGHNGFMFWDPNSELWHYIAVDFGGWGFRAAPNLLGIHDPGMKRLFERPQPRRIYYRMVHEYMNGYWQATAAGEYFAALREFAGAGIPTQLTSSRNAIVGRIAPLVDARFRILTGNGGDVVAATDAVLLEGEAPVTIDSFLQRTGTGPFETFEPQFTSVTAWKTTYQLTADQNELELLGLDRAGDVIASFQITITRAPAIAFRRGDVDGNGRLNLLDPLATLRSLLGGPILACPDAADVDDSGDISFTDAVRSLDFIFRSGPPPAPPFPEAGVDSTDDGLRCIR